VVQDMRGDAPLSDEQPYVEAAAVRQLSLPGTDDDEFADPVTSSQKTADRAPKTNGAPKAGSVEAPMRLDPPPKLSAPEIDLPDEVVAAVRLRQVLSYMLDNGFSSEETIVAECLRIKEGVPVLRTIVNLEERVQRTLSVMDVKGQFA